jgi:hypothetical protein
MNIDNSRHSNFLKIIFLFLLGFLSLNILISASVANGSDDNGFAEDLGWAAVGLISIAILYIIFYQLFINSRKILPKNDKFEKRRDTIKKIYLKVKKPLSFVHYFATFTAIIILLIHGTFLVRNENEAVIPGLIAGVFYILFVSIGFLIKVVLKKPKKTVKLKRKLFKVHTSLIILVIIIALTITHIILAD